MATSTKKKLTPLERVERSLNDAAKILNKKMHQPELGHSTTLHEVALAVADPERVVLYQVWCESESKVVTTPSTDKDAQQKLSTKHDQMNGHTSKVLSTT